MIEGICDGCGESGVLRELSGAPAVGVCVCVECYYEDKKGSEMPVLESAAINSHASESDAMAPSANVGESRVFATALSLPDSLTPPFPDSIPPC